MTDSNSTILLRRIAPHLTEVRTNFWRAHDIPSVSYPEGAHALLADIEDASFWFRHRNRVIATTVARFSRDKTFFEIGGGNGYVSLGLKRSGIETVVVEPGHEGAAIAFDRGLTVVNAAFSSDLFTPASLAAVGLFDVIEHVGEDLAFLRQCFEAMEPGGFVYITVPAHKMLWSVDDEFAGHFRRYDRGGLSKLLHAAGFETKLVSGFFTMLVPPLFLLRTLPSKLGRRRVASAEDAVAHHSSSAISRLVEQALGYEIVAIKSGIGLPFGTSLLAVARKAST